LLVVQEVQQQSPELPAALRLLSRLALHEAFAGRLALAVRAAMAVGQAAVLAQSETTLVTVAPVGLAD